MLDCICNILANDNGELIIEVYNKAYYYENTFARIKPFLQAKGRYMMSKILEKNLEFMLNKVKRLLN